MTNHTKKKKTRAIIREILLESPFIVPNDNALCIEVWRREGLSTLEEIIAEGSPASTILRARNYILYQK